MQSIIEAEKRDFGEFRMGVIKAIINNTLTNLNQSVLNNSLQDYEEKKHELENFVKNEKTKNPSNSKYCALINDYIKKIDERIEKARELKVLDESLLFQCSLSMGNMANDAQNISYFRKKNEIQIIASAVENNIRDLDEKIFKEKGVKLATSTAKTKKYGILTPQNFLPLSKLVVKEFEIPSVKKAIEGFVTAVEKIKDVKLTKKASSELVFPVKEKESRPKNIKLKTGRWVGIKNAIKKFQGGRSK